MKKIISLWVLMLCAVSLVGCSKSNESVSLISGKIMNGNKVLSVTEYSGDEAETVINNVGIIKYYLCDTTNDCSHNTGGILEEDMTSYKGKSKYYTMYHETHIYLYVPYGKGYIESNMQLNTVGLMSLSQAVEMMYNESKRLYLSDDIKAVNFNDVLLLDVNNWEFAIRESEVIIPGLITQLSELQTFNLA